MRHLSLMGTLSAALLVSCTACTTASASGAIVKASAARELANPAAQKNLAAAVAGVIGSDDGHAAVAVDNLSTDALSFYDGANGGSEFNTASIMKVDILAVFLYRLQNAGQRLSAAQEQLATTMIENSNNNSATTLFNEDGGATGISAANQAFGLDKTTVGPGGQWGLTKTTATDQVKILQQVFTSGSLLSAASRDYIQDLMSEVEADQRWGIPAAADPGSTYMVKNGWLSYPTLWSVNSIGEITHDGQKLLIAVLSDDNQSEDGGIDLVQQIAASAAGAATATG